MEGPMLNISFISLCYAVKVTNDADSTEVLLTFFMPTGRIQNVGAGHVL